MKAASGRRRRGGQGYIADCGTSMAAPVVTGIVALMRAAAGEMEILPSTYKAILVATAHDLALQPGLETWPENPDIEGLRTFYGSGPDWATGFGLVDAGAAFAAVENRHWHEGEVATEAPLAAACFDVPEGAALRIALAWDDPAPASTDFGHAMLVNDLDLTLTGPDGAPHLPWVLHPPDFGGDLDALLGPASNDLKPADLLPAERGRDRLNNVELVEVSQPAPGVWRASVEAVALGDGPQRFSLGGGNVMRDCDG